MEYISSLNSDLFICICNQDDFGNEVEIGDEHEQNQDDQVNLGPYINIAYLRSLEEKIRQQAKVLKTKLK